MTPKSAAPKAGPGGAKKKPWQPPQVKSGKLFESNSIGCNKLPVFVVVDCQETNPPPSAS
jgi:hypothetical protein